MRRLTSIAVLALALGGCGKQLNAEFCLQNPHDQDCINAGFVSIDAPVPCTVNAQCPMPGMTVCDVQKSECVPCTPMDPSPCASTSTPKCGPDDQCHECLVDNDCSGGGMCLPDLTCVSSDSFLYAAPGLDGTCFKGSPCRLKTAIGLLDLGHRVISVAPGDYQEGPLTIAKDAVLIGQGAMGDPSLTTVTNVAGQQGPIFTIQTAQIALDYLSVYGSDSDGVTCTSGGVNFHHSNSHDNGGFGLSASGGCALSIDRGKIYKNAEAAISTNSSAIQIFNNFIYDNGTGNAGGGAVRLGPSTTGELAYNSISFNTFKASNTDGGLSCNNNATATVDFNIIAGNQGKQSYTPGGCTLTDNYVGQNADGVHYQSMVAPYDLHLTPATPIQGPDPRMIEVRDNRGTTCVMNNINLDIDGQARPAATFCDLGADEYQ